MAEDFTENEYSEREVLKIQALFRGVLVRKWMKETREIYEKIFKELERSSPSETVWRHDNLCKPIIQKKDNKRRSQQVVNSPVFEKTTEKIQTSRPRTFTPVQTVPLQTEPTAGLKSSEQCGVGLQSDGRSLGSHFLTVETQTSFCEPSPSSENNYRNEQCVQTGNEVKEHEVMKILEVPVNIQEPKHKDTHVTVLDTASATSERAEQRENIDIVDKVTRESTSKESVSSKKATEISSKGMPSPRGNPEVTPCEGTSGVLSSEKAAWDSFHNISAPANDPAQEAQYPQNYESLQEMKKNIAMELLWVQQAINSRKNYLKLKGQMSTV